MMKEYARFDNQSSENYLKEYNLDREKTFRYYLFPADDLAAVYWGYIFEGIKCRCVLVEDNYLIFASSESAVKSFARDYVHGSVIRDAEWYRHLKTRLAGKYNMAYFARTAEVLPFYTSLTQGSWQQFPDSTSKGTVCIFYLGLAVVQRGRYALYHSFSEYSRDKG